MCLCCVCANMGLRVICDTGMLEYEDIFPEQQRQIAELLSSIGGV